MSAAATLAGAAPDEATTWHAINWLQVWRTVRRLQARIVKAVQEGRWNKVHALVYWRVAKNGPISDCPRFFISSARVQGGNYQWICLASLLCPAFPVGSPLRRQLSGPR